MKTFTIMFSDLNDEAKTQFLQFEGVESVSELNTDLIPLATVTREEEINESV